MVSPFDSDDMSTNIFNHRSTLKIYTKTSLNVVKKTGEPGQNYEQSY